MNQKFEVGRNYLAKIEQGVKTRLVRLDSYRECGFYDCTDVETSTHLIIHEHQLTPIKYDDANPS